MLGAEVRLPRDLGSLAVRGDRDDAAERLGFGFVDAQRDQLASLESALPWLSPFASL